MREKPHCISMNYINGGSGSGQTIDPTSYEVYGETSMQSSHIIQKAHDIALNTDFSTKEIILMAIDVALGYEDAEIKLSKIDEALVFLEEIINVE